MAALSGTTGTTLSKIWQWIYAHKHYTFVAVTGLFLFLDVIKPTFIKDLLIILSTSLYFITNNKISFK
jgi:hypothetical protein